MRHLLICSLVLAALCTGFGGCNPAEDEGTTADAVAVTASSEDGTGTEAQSPPPVQLSDEALPSDGTAEEDGAAEEPAETDAAEGEPSITGRWFALFGRHDLGVIERGWVDGHLVEFVESGEANWTRLESGRGVTGMASTWRLRGTELTLSFADEAAVDSGMHAIAPLGIGRDEEIGLLSGGIPGEGTGTLKQVDHRLKAVVEEQYMALTDFHGRLMIYGREWSDPPREAPDLTGSWVGHIDMHDNFPAVFEWDGESLIARYEHNDGEFTGEYVRGYFVGRAKEAQRLSLAAVTLTSDNWLDGVFCPDPYGEMRGRFDFMRSD